MRAFLRQEGFAVALLDSEEKAVIRHLVEDVQRLLEADEVHRRGGEPTDPVILRLLPNAAPTESEVAAEFRRLAEHDLRSVKLENLRGVVIELECEGPEWVVPLDRAMATAAALTDVRLVLASRLGLGADDDADLLEGELEMAEGLLEHGLPEGLDLDHQRLWQATVYQALTWLQDSLVACLMSEKGGDDE